MLRRFLVARVQAFCGLIAILVLFNFSLTPAQAQTDHWLTGYYATYNMSVMTPQQVDYTKLTHVIYWPVIPNTNGTLNETPFGLSQTSFNSGATALVAGAHAAGAKALIGIGGNSDSGASAGFSGSTTPANLTAFVNNIVALMQLYGFDGVDINWEEISANSSSDNAQFTAFIGALRTKLNTITPRPLLTMAPAVTSIYSLQGTVTTQKLIASVASDFDQLNIQTYIMAGPYCGWETWYNAPLNNGGQDFLLDPGSPLPTANNLIASYASAGIPMAKMAVGIQFDAATWTGGAGTSTGGATKPYQTWSDDASNCGTNPAAPIFNTTPYRVMITTLAKQAGVVVEPMDTVADQNWLSYDPSGAGTTNEANDMFVSYDSPQSIAKKGTDLAAQEASVGALGGVFIFELSGDYAGSGVAASAQHPLLDAANQMANLLPGAVTGLSATPSMTSITLKWTAVPFASTYQVYQSTSATTQGTAIGPVTSPTMVVSGLTSGTTYYFQVEPGNSFGYSAGGIAKTSAATTAGGLTTPKITWAAPAPMTYLQPLGSTQLDATASVAGTFVYSPAAGTKLTAGTQTLSVTFTPTDTADYTTATASVTVTVNKATTVLTWPTPAPILTTTALSATQLNATANVPGLLANIPGTFAYTPAAGTPLPPGTNTLRVTFTPTDTTDLTSASAQVSETVYVPTPAIVWPTPSAVYYGTALSNKQLDATDTVAGTFVYTPPAGTILLEGTQTLSVTFTPSAANGQPLTASQSIRIVAAAPLPPAGLTATGGPDQIALTWSASTYASGYYVYRSTSEYSGYAQIGSPTTTSYTDTTTQPGIPYYYQVRAWDSTGLGGGAGPVPAKATLPAPTGLTATVSGESINLKWNASAGAIQYAVQRGVANGGPYNTYLGSTTATSYVDGTAIPGTTYYYVVAAVADPPNSVAIESAYSNQASAKTTAQTLPAPTGLAAYLAQGGGGATLTWPAVTGATGYNILRSTVSGGPYKLVASNYFAPYLRYSDIPLAGGTYYWVIQAQNSSGTSPYSNQASLTVPNLPIPSVPTFSIGIYQGVPVVTANNDGDVLFEFYRSSSKSGPYTLMETSDIYNFFDYSAVSGNTYYYELTASNNSGTSAFTAPQSVTVPFAPSNVKATAGNGQVALSWTGVSGASSYTVYYGTVAGNPDTEGGPTTATNLLITGLTNGTPYYFEVEATLADGVSTTAFSTMVSATPVAPQTITWIPDWDGELLQVRVGSGTSATAITISLPACNPNSVAVNQNKAYVACNANGANPDKILVYNATTIRAAAAGTLNIAPLQTITSTDFNSLIGIAFDSSNDLWVASNGNNEVLEFTAASLATATPADIVSLVDSPASPVALAFDTDGSLWVTGLYGGGILLNFQPSQFGLGGNANPRYCAVTEPQGGICISQANLFLEPEGVAVFNGSVWVANNSTTGSNGLGGATPGRELVNLTYAGGTLAVAGIYGSVVPDTGGTATSPFFCPGGLYATADHLWVNDESYGEATPQCGANGDSASKTGGVFSFTPAQLTAKPVTQVPAFTNVTGRPGFGGIFVEFD